MSKPSTKDRILDAALVLFNDEGLETVSTRRIAQALGISQGNLCYHFPHKDQIVEALYQRLRDEFSRLLGAMQAQDLSFEGLSIASYEMLRVQYRYKFLMLNFVQVMRQYPAIQADFQALFAARRQELSRFYQVLAAKGWLRDDIPPEQFDFLSRSQYILGNFWMAEAEIQDSSDDQSRVAFYTRLLASLIWPYLSAEGRHHFDLGQAALTAYLAAQVSQA